MIGTRALQAQGMPPAVVKATLVTERAAAESRRYTGLLQSPSRVILVARVSGELLKVGFEDGDLVKAGQLLYQLDDLRYEANVKVAEANIARCEANLAYSKSNFARIDALYKKNVTTLDAMESARMQYHADEASLASAKAALITAKDDYRNTKIVAPIDGKISITNYTIGNYLTPSSGTLATLVQVNPIRLSFSISNRDFQQLFGTEENFKRDAKVTIRLADGKEYGEIATFDFINNEANRSTDTLQFYMLLKNDKYQLIPNSTVTVNVLKRLGGTYAAIPLSALMSDSQSSYVYVLNDEDVPARRDIVLGAIDGGFQLVKSGLKPGERIISVGTHKVRPGMKVQVVQ